MYSSLAAFNYEQTLDELPRFHLLPVVEAIVLITQTMSAVGEQELHHFLR
jgi:hypothetical protein